MSTSWSPYGASGAPDPPRPPAPRGFKLTVWLSLLAGIPIGVVWGISEGSWYFGLYLSPLFAVISLFVVMLTASVVELVVVRVQRVLAWRRERFERKVRTILEPEQT